MVGQGEHSYVDASEWGYVVEQRGLVRMAARAACASRRDGHYDFCNAFTIFILNAACMIWLKYRHVTVKPSLQHGWDAKGVIRSSLS
jgi:hypothetical protein